MSISTTIRHIDAALASLSRGGYGRKKKRKSKSTTTRKKSRRGGTARHLTKHQVRVRAARKAARTRAAKKAVRRRAAKKGVRTRKSLRGRIRRVTSAIRRRVSRRATPKKRKPSRSRHGSNFGQRMAALRKRRHTARVKAGRKGARARKSRRGAPKTRATSRIRRPRIHRPIRTTSAGFGPYVGVHASPVRVIGRRRRRRV